MVPIHVNPTEPMLSVIGLPYFEMTIPPATAPTVIRGNNDVISEYCLLLPVIERNGFVTRMEGELLSSVRKRYAVIESRWKYLSHDQQQSAFRLPKKIKQF